MFKKILIANRGEIAVRIHRTCRDMGIPTVMVYSTVDKHQLHAQMGNEAYCIGGPNPLDSYMNQDAILTTALGTGCDAIHPGYGFLSEDASFAKAVEDAGLTFIGPHPETIALLGNKAKARQLMIEAGVPVIPGSDGVLESVDEAKAIAERVGYPVLLKARSGGGGRGMRLVQKAEDLEEAYHAASLEAERVFDDPALYLEKYLTNSKHLEFQILADKKGHVIHLGERDCSLQRRKQKMIGEAPAYNFPQAMREKMGKVAVRAAKAAHFLGAGTVEFLLNGDKFYFIEVNTRIQVEHPVTEMVTGLDLVAEQIRLAYGSDLPLTQDEVQLHGHAIEVRINAEKPYEDFALSPGNVRQILLPGGIGVRIDTALYPGCEISSYYDPLIMKIIVHGRDRREVMRRMRRAIEELMIEGIETNAAFIYALLFELYVVGVTTTDSRRSHRSLEDLRKGCRRADE